MHLHDMNVRKDPEAVRTVLAGGIPLTVMSFSASANLVVTTDDLAQLDHQSGFAGELAEMSKPWLLVWRYLFWAEGFRPFAAITSEALDCNEVAAMVTPPRILTTYGVVEVADTSQRILYCDGAGETR